MEPNILYNISQKWYAIWPLIRRLRIPRAMLWRRSSCTGWSAVLTAWIPGQQLKPVSNDSELAPLLAVVILPVVQTEMRFEKGRITFSKIFKSDFSGSTETGKIDISYVLFFLAALAPLTIYGHAYLGNWRAFLTVL